jgi:hypothetical protein
MMEDARKMPQKMPEDAADGSNMRETWSRHGGRWRDICTKLYDCSRE